MRTPQHSLEQQYQDYVCLHGCAHACARVQCDAYCLQVGLACMDGWNMLRLLQQMYDINVIHVYAAAILHCLDAFCTVHIVFEYVRIARGGSSHNCRGCIFPSMDGAGASVRISYGLSYTTRRCRILSVPAFFCHVMLFQ